MHQLFVRSKHSNNFSFKRNSVKYLSFKTWIHLWNEVLTYCMYVFMPHRMYVCGYTVLNNEMPFLGSGSVYTNVATPRDPSYRDIRNIHVYNNRLLVGAHRNAAYSLGA